MRSRRLAACAQLACALWLFLSTFASAQEETLAFQSDVTRLMSVVVSHLYHQRDVFLRELISNAGDAIEKSRMAALRSASDSESSTNFAETILQPTNITIKANPELQTLTITDTGIGMTHEELTKNLGTIARSGTSELLDQMDSSGVSGENLIGKFGLGFYSSFLVAERVQVTSKSDKDSEQWIFEADANSANFKIRPDPNGSWLGRGTEIILFLKSDASEFLQEKRLRSLISKHSEFSTSSPIYLWTGDNKSAAESSDTAEFTEGDKVLEQNEQSLGWERLNDRPPLWMLDPKSVQESEYKDFYKAIAKDNEDPLLWTHFKGDAGRTTFNALIYIPNKLPESFYSKTYQTLKSLRLYVRRVFITSDAGPSFLPQWLDWIKVIVDADDLPLNVGRDSLQKSRDLVAIKRNIPKKVIDLLSRTARETPDLYSIVFSKIGSALKVGAIEDEQRRSRIIDLIRFPSSNNASVSLDDYVSRAKKGQSQIFYVAATGANPSDLEKSVFTETALARGYEVFYFVDPVDEMIATRLQEYKGLRFHDVAKKGMIFGDEETEEAEKEEKSKLEIKYKPLVSWMKKELDDVVNDVSISSRLTTSPCAIVADAFAWTGNMERLMSAQASSGQADDIMMQFYKSQKRSLEINPHHPLVEGLLDRVMEVEGYEEETDQLRETVRILWDTALVKSGFTVSDVNAYFSRVETLLRKSLGVSETAKVSKIDVRPAPPVAERNASEEPVASPPDYEYFDDDEEDEEDGERKQKWEDWSSLKQKLANKKPTEENADTDANLHDEL